MRKVEKFLRKYGRLARAVSDIQEEIYELIDKKRGLPASLLRPPILTGQRVQGGRQKDLVYEVVEKSVDIYDAMIQRKSERLRDLAFDLDETEAHIKRANLANREKKFIDLRYVQGKTYPEIAQELVFSERQIYRIGKTALQKVKTAI